MKLSKFGPVLSGLLIIALAPLLSAADEADQDSLVEAARDKESDFESQLAAAREAGMPDAWLLEAEIVRALSTSDLQGMMELLPRIDSVGDDFRFGLSRDFHSARQLEGFADTLRCAQAYREDRMDDFEKYAIASYANAPDFNVMFGIGELLARQRVQEVQEEAMADVRVPLDMVLANAEGESRSLRDWMGENDYMLVDFWASWCGPCIRNMPGLKEKQASLSEQGVFVAGINTDRQDQLNKALQVRSKHEMESVPWLLDNNGSELSGLLMIDSIPRMVLVDREGAVLFNGHPVDPALGQALAKVGVTL